MSFFFRVLVRVELDYGWGMVLRSIVYYLKFLLVIDLGLELGDECNIWGFFKRFRWYGYWRSYVVLCFVKDSLGWVLGGRGIWGSRFFRG